MTEFELARILGVDIEGAGDLAYQLEISQPLVDHIFFLQSQYDNSHFVIDDDEPIQVIAEIEESKIEYAPPQFSFVRKWRDQTGDESNVIPMNVIIHNPAWIKKCEMERRRKKLLEKQRAMEMDFDDVLSKEGA